MANIRSSRKSGFILRGGVTRRETVWISIVSAADTLATPQTGSLLGSLNAAALALRPFTIVRTRGVFYLGSDQAAATEDQAAALGGAVVSDQAVAVGITALPTPITDKSSDLWFMFQSLMSNIAFLTAAGFQQPAGQQLIYDSRAMRKVEDGQDIVIMAESDVAAVTAGVEIRHGGRMLLKLH